MAGNRVSYIVWRPARSVGEGRAQTVYGGVCLLPQARSRQDVAAILGQQSRKSAEAGVRTRRGAPEAQAGERGIRGIRRDGGNGWSNGDAQTCQIGPKVWPLSRYRSGSRRQRRVETNRTFCSGGGPCAPIHCTGAPTGQKIRQLWSSLRFLRTFSGSDQTNGQTTEGTVDM